MSCCDFGIKRVKRNADDAQIVVSFAEPRHIGPIKRDAVHAFNETGPMAVAMSAHGISTVARLAATRRSTTCRVHSCQSSAFVGKALPKKVHLAGSPRRKYLGLSVRAVQTYVVIPATFFIQIRT